MTCWICNQPITEEQPRHVILSGASHLGCEDTLLGIMYACKDQYWARVYIAMVRPAKLYLDTKAEYVEVAIPPPEYQL